MVHCAQQLRTHAVSRRTFQVRVLLADALDAPPEYRCCRTSWVKLMYHRLPLGLSSRTWIQGDRPVATLTRPYSGASEPGSPSRHTQERDRLERNGVGCTESTTSGVRAGNTFCWKNFVASRRCRSVRSFQLRSRMPCFSSLGRSAAKHSCCCLTMATITARRSARSSV